MPAHHPSMRPSTLYYGDCLEVGADWPSESVDLIYLDPPFNSKQQYSCLFHTLNGVTAQMNAFNDMWKWEPEAADRVQRMSHAFARPSSRFIEGMHTVLGDCGMMSYLSYMAERLELLQRLLKPTGSLWLHCDPTANGYLRVLLDAVFGADKLRNEVSWCYTGPGNTKRWFPRKHDTLFWYTKGEEWTFNNDVAEVRKPYRSGLHNEGTVFGKTDGNPAEVRAQEEQGKLVESWWPDIGAGAHISVKERTGYGTEKPLKLLQRIIMGTSNPGDMVLDPFCGSGPTIGVADENGREWVGIDLQPYALELCRRRRLRPTATVRMDGIPKDLSSARVLHTQSAFKFEAWAIMRIPGMLPNQKQRGDGGVDGIGRAFVLDPEGRDLVLAQVKGGKYKADDMRAFLHVLATRKAAVGVFITMDVCPPAERAARAAGTFKVGGTSYRRVVTWSIQAMFEHIPLVLPPMLDPRTGKELQREMFA